MSSTIDSKVLEMKFLNDDFEKNVKTSLSSLANLQKGVDNVEKSSSSGMPRLSEGANEASRSFSALEAVAFGFLTRLGSMAADTGVRLAKSLSVDQIAAGWSKYEDKTAAVQTIMAATQQTWEANAETVGFVGTQMDFVSQQLQRLNWFTDETSYSFSDMTNNIGKFTSNNIALTDAVEAMEGISSWAALSGAGIAGASRAMYNLAQAMSVGSVKLIDWKSIENANMATAEFKQTAIDTAIELGTLQKSADGVITTVENGAEVSVTKFNQELSTGWFNSEVLMKSLKRYGNFAVKLGEICEEYGLTASQFLVGLDAYTEGTRDINAIANQWGVTAEELLPLFEELNSAEYELGKKAFKAAQEAKTFTEAIDATKDAVSTKWLNIFETIFGNYEQAKTLWTDVANWLYDVFADPLDNLQTLLDGWSEEGRPRFVQGLTNMMDTVTRFIDTFKEAFHIVFPETTVEGLINLSRWFVIITSRILNADGAFDTISRALVTFFNAIQIVWRAVGSIKDGFKDVFNFGDAGQTIKTIVFNLFQLSQQIKLNDGIFENIRRTARGFFSILSIGVTIIKSVAKIFGSLFNQIFPATKGILNLTGNIGDFFVKIDQGLKNSERFKNIIESISNAVASALPIIKRLVTAVKEFIEKISSSTIQLFSEKISLLPKIISVIATFIAKAGSSLVSLLGTILDTISNSLGNLDFNKISELFGTVLFGGIGVAIYKGFAAISDVLEGLGNTLGAFEKNIEAQTLNTIAKSILMIAAALVVVSMIDPDRLLGSVAAISALTAVLIEAANLLAGPNSSTIVGAVKGIGDAFSFSQKSSGVVKLAASLVILSVALKIISTIEPNRLLECVGVLTIVMGEIVLFSKLLSDNSSSILKGATSMLPFSIGLLIISAAFKVFASMTWDELLKGLASFTVIIGMVVGASLLLSSNKSKMLKGAGAMLPFAVGITIMAAAFKIFATMKWEDLGKSMAAFVGIIATVVGMTLLLQKKSLALVAIGAGLVVFSVGVTILAAAMKIFATMSWDDIARGMVALIGTLAAVTAMTAILQNNSTALLKISAGLVVFAAGMAILVPVLKLLATMSWEDIAKAGVVLAGLFTILGLAGLILEPVVPVILKLSAALILIGAGSALFGAGLVLIGIGLTAIGTGLAAFGNSLLGFLTNLLNFMPTVIQIIARFLEGILTTVTSLIGTFAPQLLQTAVKLITIFCESIITAAPILFDTLISLFDILIEYTPQIVDRLANFIIAIFESLSSKMPPIITAIFGFIKSTFQALGEAFGGASINDFSLALLELAGATAILALIGNTGATALIGLGILAAIIVGLGALMVGLGALLTYVPEIEDFLERGIPVLEKIGYGIGSFIGNFVGGLMAGITSGLPEMATNFSLFMTNLQPFLDGLSNVDPGIADAAFAIAGAMLAFTAANLIDSIASFLTGGSGIEKFAEKIIPFAEAIINFSDIIAASNLDTEAIEKAANAGKLIAEMASAIPNSGGVVGFFAGENDIDAFAEKIGPYATAIVDFADIVKDIDTSGVEAATNAGKLIAEMSDTIPNSGGVVGFFAGENDLDAFAEKIVPYATAIADFARIVKDIDTSGVQGAVDAGKLITDMADTIPNSGGLVGFFAGENDIDTFAAKIVPFGEALRDYSKAITEDGGIDSAAIEASAIVGAALIELANTVPGSGGIVEWFTGQNDLDKFGEKLSSFGKALADYDDAISGKDFSNTELSAAIAMDLANVAATVPPDTNRLKDFGSALKSFGEAFVSYAQYVTGFTEISMLNATIARTYNLVDLFQYMGDHDSSAVEGFSKALDTLADTGITKFIENFDAADTRVSNAIDGFVTGIITAFGDTKSRFLAIGKDLVGQFIKAFYDSYEDAMAKGKILAEDARSGIRSVNSEFYNAGVYVVQGYINGMLSKSESVWNAAYELGVKALEAAKYATDSNSPSAAFEALGEYNAEGYANGMYSSVRMVADAAGEMGEASLSEVEGIMSEIAACFDADLGPEDFTITPVLDLSQIQNGASQIGGMFSSAGVPLGSVSSSLSYTLGAANGINLESRHRDYNDSKVVSAITDLNSRMDSLGQSIANMKIMLDTGALVGGISEPMNQSLGRLSVRANRGG